jgi:hypothetical protein
MGRVGGLLTHCLIYSLLISTFKEYFSVVNLHSYVLVCVDGCDICFMWKVVTGRVQGVSFVTAFLYQKLQ